MADLAYVAPVFRVADLARSLAFYRERLGFELDFSYENVYASVCRDEGYVHLQCGEREPRDQAAFERAGRRGAWLVVREAGTLSARFPAAGVAFSVPLRRMPYGTEFYVRDPDGYIL